MIFCLINVLAKNKQENSVLLIRGGGVAISLATVGGLKIQDSVNYQAQVKKYAKVKAKFKDGVNSIMPGWYLPTWQNEKVWEQQRSNYIGKNQSFAKQFPTPFSFRDHCYRHAQNTGFDKCTGSEGWCMECGRDPSWTPEEKFK